jgi:hypothetical protein
MKEQLTPDEQDVLHAARKFGEAEASPIINPYWERGDFPFELVPKIAKLNVIGDRNMQDSGVARATNGSSTAPSVGGEAPSGATSLSSSLAMAGGSRRSIACLSSPAMPSPLRFPPEPAPKDAVAALPALIDRRRGAAGGGPVKSARRN